MLRIPSLAPCYQLVLTREGHLDQLEVHVEERPVSTGEAPPDPEFVGRELQHHIKGHVGVTTRVVVLAPGSIARSEGKAKRIVDNRPKA